MTVMIMLITLKINAKEITCGIYQGHIFDSSTHENTCDFDESTVIDSDDYTIYNAKNETVTSMSLDDNKKVEFLPIRVFQSFPNIDSYSATSCSIREISKENFEGLLDLSVISLMGNQILMILSNTFQGLPVLNFLDLREIHLNFQTQETLHF